MVALSKSNPYYGGQGHFKYITGAFYLPNGFSCPNGVPMTVTATRVYYTPFSVDVPKTFAGAAVYNSGTSANGQKCRIMVFRDDGAIGGPGTLEKTFGEITFDATSKVSTLASSWAANPGLYWLATWFDSATAMYGMHPYTYNTAVGGGQGSNITDQIGILSGMPGATWNCIVHAHYVDTTYGAAPSTAVAPTSSLAGPYASGTPLVPVVALKG